MAADPQASAGRRARRIAAAVVGLVIAGILALVIALRWSVTTDITHFLADQEDAELAAISSQLADSELTRAWIISVGGGDEDEVLAAARELGERLAAHPEVKWIQRGIEGGGGEAFYDLYFPRRLYFVSDRPAIEIPAKISDAGLAEAAQGLLRELSLPQATLIKEIAASDPLLIFPAIVRRLAAAESGGLRPVGDQLLSEDGHALIFLSTVHSPFDGAAMAPLAAAIGEATAAVNADHGGRLTFEESALARHALAAEASIRGDVTRISTISTIGLVLLFLVMFRAPRLVLLVMLPLAYGVLAALAATLALLCTAGPIAVALPLGVLLFSAVATHLAAIGLGDALGHRVNALMVGALTAFGIVVPGVAGAALVTQKVSGAGLLLGPLAPVLAGITGLTGLAPADAMIAYDASFGGAILGYALVVQGLLGAICLLSWRRRVEQAWTPLFRPAEGIALAVASVGCSGLALLDLSERLNTQSFDKLNMVTFLASSFLLPLLGWLLVASLRRPARATAIASHQETRAAFWRFQGVIALTAAIVGIIYHFAMNRSGLGAEPSELMWATLTQVLLIAETALGTLLWASRRREGKARVAMLGGALIVLQTAFAALTYSLEVDFVAIHHQAGAPFLMGMSASPYWIALMIVLWGGGLGLILTALLRDRDRIAAENQAAQEQDESDDEEGHHRWLH
ncbi:MAG: hypothetical protein KC420_08375 [Myxococcales bacterium]|nr:hypothetical protein [Myxococcales bacterium]